ncbi:MAG TPA: histidinol dehydrogenase [Actinomycetota bacterium]|nr:histidinol dehydrogenase [Actinomycetota bacterium]
MLRLLDADREPPQTLRPALDPAVEDRVRSICERVRRDGDAALVALTRELDGADVDDLAIPAEEVDGAEVPAPLAEAIDRMAARLRELHGHQLPLEWQETADGVTYGEVVRPLASVGCYVPGGRASYPSTVLMTAVPAGVAGVGRVALCTPPDADGSVPAAVLRAAKAAGVEEVYRIGGAQAIAALAYGTESIPPVDKIVGPGNAWVTAAKRQVSGVVGIDALAGPTELVVVAGAVADPVMLASDLVAQSEHDPAARTTLICLDASLPEKVQRALETEVERSPRRDIVDPALAGSAAYVVDSEKQAARLIDRLAPEHLQVVTDRPREFLRLVRSFGAAFLGPFTPVPFGDYGVGSNHVLPTMSTARFSSGLRASDFVTMSSVVEATAEAAGTFGPDVELLAEAEGLPGHARASEVRR